MTGRKVQQKKKKLKALEHKDNFRLYHPNYPGHGHPSRGRNCRNSLFGKG